MVKLVKLTTELKSTFLSWFTNLIKSLVETSNGQAGQVGQAGQADHWAVKSFLILVD